jgi:integrase
MSSFRDFAADVLAADDLRPGTLRSYDSALRCHILPAIGDREVSSIDAAQIRVLFADMRRRDVGPGAIHMTRKVLNKVLRVALEDGLLERNPMASLRLPARSKVTLDPPSKEDVAAIAAAITPRHRALVLVLAWTGLRIGEAGGLTVDDYDPVKRRLLVRRQSTSYGMADLKTAAARRVVAVPRFVADELDAHLEKYPPVDGRLFSTTHGTPIRASKFYSTFTRACDRAGLRRRFHPHELRHHAVSAMARSGAPIKAVQAAVGHTSAKLTLEVYSHVSEDDLQAIADRLDEAV